MTIAFWGWKFCSLTKWIKCTDRLPSINTSILIVIAGDVRYGQLGRCDDGVMWYLADGEALLNEASYWTSLPIPPKMKKNK